MRAPKLPGNHADWNQSRELAPLAFTPLRQHWRESSTFCRADYLASSKPPVGSVRKRPLEAPQRRAHIGGQCSGRLGRRAQLETVRARPTGNTSC
jgi:hypothetical protein